MFDVAPAPAVPEVDTVAHYVLHTILKGQKKKGVDWRSVSEMASTGGYESTEHFWQGLFYLLDAGVAERKERKIFSGDDEAGYRVIIPCQCQFLGEPKDFEGSRGRARNNKTVACDGADYVCPSRKPPSSAEAGAKADSWASRQGGGLSRARVGYGTEKHPADDPWWDSPYGLATIFERALNAHRDLGSWGNAMWGVNKRVLLKHFGESLRAGIDPDDIKATFEAFFARPPYRLRKPVWKLYLDKRQALLDDVLQARQARAASTADKAYFDVTPERQDVSEEDIRSLYAL